MTSIRVTPQSVQPPQYGQQPPPYAAPNYGYGGGRGPEMPAYQPVQYVIGPARPAAGPAPRSPQTQSTALTPKANIDTLLRNFESKQNKLDIMRCKLFGEATRLIEDKDFETAHEVAEHITQIVMMKDVLRKTAIKMNMNYLRADANKEIKSAIQSMRDLLPAADDESEISIEEVATQMMETDLQNRSVLEKLDEFSRQSNDPSGTKTNRIKERTKQQILQQLQEQTGVSLPMQLQQPSIQQQLQPRQSIPQVADLVKQMQPS